MATPWQHCALVAASVLGAGCLLGCLRPLLGDEGFGEDGGGDLGTGDVDDLGATSATRPGEMPDDDGDESSAGEPSPPDPACHASYTPCLPIVDDLNCADVIALGAAPVTVIGPDDYRLDADRDGIGCES